MMSMKDQGFQHPEVRAVTGCTGTGVEEAASQDLPSSCLLSDADYPEWLDVRPRSSVPGEGVIQQGVSGGSPV